jgi:hypothetical protein
MNPNWGGQKPLQTLKYEPTTQRLSIQPGNSVILSGSGSGPNSQFTTITVSDTGYISTLTTAVSINDLITANETIVSSLSAYSEFKGHNSHFTGTFDVSASAQFQGQVSATTLTAPQVNTQNLIGSTLTLQGSLNVLPGLHDVNFGTDALHPIRQLQVFAGDIDLYSENPLATLNVGSAGDVQITALNEDITLTAANNIDLTAKDINLTATGLTDIMNIQAAAAMTLTTGAAMTINAGAALQIGSAGHVNIGSLSGLGTEIENISINDNVITKTPYSANIELNDVSKVSNQDPIATKGSLTLNAKEDVNITSDTGRIVINSYNETQIENTFFSNDVIGNFINDIQIVPSGGTGTVHIYDTVDVAKVKAKGYVSTKTLYADTAYISSTNISSLRARTIDISSALFSTLTVSPINFQKGTNTGANIPTVDITVNDTDQLGSLRLRTLAFNTGHDVANDVFAFLDGAYNPSYWLQSQGPKKIAFQQSEQLTELFSTTTTHASATYMDANEARIKTLLALEQPFIEAVNDIQMAPGTKITGNLHFQEISGNTVNATTVKALNGIITNSELNSTTVQELHLRSYIPGVPGAHLTADTLDGQNPAIFTADVNTGNGANLAIIGPTGPGNFPILGFFDPNNGFNGASLSYRYSSNGSVLRTGVGLETYNSQRIVRRINEGPSRLQFVAQNHPSPGQFTSTSVEYDAQNSRLRFINTSLSLEAPSGQKAFLAMKSGSHDAAITYESPSTSPFNRFYFGGAGLSANNFMSLDGTNPYVQLFDVNNSSLARWKWRADLGHSEMNKPMVVASEYVNNTPYIGISDGSPSGNMAKMTYNISNNVIAFNKNIEASHVYCGTLHYNHLEPYFTPTATRGSVDTSLQIDATAFNGNLLDASSTVIWPYDTYKMKAFNISVNLQGQTNWTGHLGFYLTLYNVSTGATVNGYCINNNQIQVSEPAVFANLDVHSETLTDLFEVSGLVSQGDTVEVVCMVQANSGYGNFTTGRYVIQISPVVVE